MVGRVERMLLHPLGNVLYSHGSTVPIFLWLQFAIRYSLGPQKFLSSIKIGNLLDLLEMVELKPWPSWELFSCILIMKIPIRTLELLATQILCYSLLPAKPHDITDKCNLLLWETQNLFVDKFKQPLQMQLLMVGLNCNEIASYEPVMLFSYQLVAKWFGVLHSARASFYTVVQHAEKLMDAAICSLIDQNTPSLHHTSWNGWSSLLLVHVYQELELGGVLSKSTLYHDHCLVLICGFVFLVALVQIGQTGMHVIEPIILNGIPIFYFLGKFI
jgi:hypothetical protein